MSFLAHLQSRLIGHRHHSQEAAVGVRGMIVMKFVFGACFLLKAKMSKSAEKVRVNVLQCACASDISSPTYETDSFLLEDSNCLFCFSDAIAIMKTIENGRGRCN